MKTLHSIQVLSKIGRVLSKIVFICSLVGVGLCIAGLISLSVGADELLKIGGVTLHGLLGVGAEEGRILAAETMAGYLVIGAGEAVVAKYAERYFRNELAAGTPFSRDGAGEMKRLGILTIAIPAGCTLAAVILIGIAEGFMDIAPDTPSPSFDFGTSVVLGIMFLVLSLVFRYGAELTDGDPGRRGADQAEDPSLQSL